MKKEEKNGLFVSFEGIDGCGKSSIMRRVNEILTARGYNVYSVREPGGVPISESIKAGCPVVSTNISSVPEVAGDAGLLVDEIKVENFIDEIMKVIVSVKSKDFYIELL